MIARSTSRPVPKDAAAPIFPGWRWAAIALAFPIVGLIGWTVSGPVDAPAAALLGGSLTGAGLGAAQWLAAKEAFGDGRIWIATSGVAYAAGLAAGAAIVGYETDIGSVEAMGAISGLVLGAGQGLVLRTGPSGPISAEPPSGRAAWRRLRLDRDRRLTWQWRFDRLDAHLKFLQKQKGTQDDD